MGLSFLELGPGVYSGKGAPLPKNYYNYYSPQDQNRKSREMGVTFNNGIGYRLFDVEN